LSAFRPAKIAPPASKKRVRPFSPDSFSPAHRRDSDFKLAWPMAGLLTFIGEQKKGADATFCQFSGGKILEPLGRNAFTIS
jgi:hypothetical protein